jgi:Carbohydrate-binding module 48 (Isoamylase N-terminal domain)
MWSLLLLGSRRGPRGTTFRGWAPNATAVSVSLRSSLHTLPMTSVTRGYWQLEVPGSLRKRYFAPSSRAPRRSRCACRPTFFIEHDALLKAAGCHISPSSKCSWTRAFADLSALTPRAAGRQVQRAAAQRHRPRSPRLTANLTANLHGQRRTRAHEHGQRVVAHKYAADADGPPRTPGRRLRKPLLYPLSYEATYSKRPPNHHLGSNLTANLTANRSGMSRILAVSRVQHDSWAVPR